MIVIRDYGTHVKVFNLKKRGLLGLIFAYALNGVNAMKKPRNRFIKNLHYLCLIGAITLGLMTIVATGGVEVAGANQSSMYLRGSTGTPLRSTA